MNLFNAKLSPAQVQALYTQISQGTKLRLVSMGHVDIRQDLSHSCLRGSKYALNFSGVPPAITGAALNRLNIAKLCNSNITTSQLEAILR